MQYLEDFIDAGDGHEIPVRLWRPNTVDKILVICHGMAEYCERYTPLADWLTESNIAVIAMNHRGHGMDCPDDDLGYFADHFGWQKVIEDVDATVEFVKKQIPDVPVSLFGHSMGSFIAQNYTQLHGEKLEQVILSASNRIDRPKMIGSQLMISFIKFYKGKKATSKLVDHLSFGVFNNKFKPNRTEMDWLSRDEDHVDAYVADPFCGFSCSLLMWQDFLTGMLSIKSQKWSNTLPIHLLSGSSDPVGEFSRGVGQLAEQLKSQGKNLTTFKLYEGARHEIVNETNSQEVWQDIKQIVLNGECDAI